MESQQRDLLVADDARCEAKVESTIKTRCDGLNEEKGLEMQVAKRKEHKQCDVRKEKRTKGPRCKKVWSRCLPKC